ncbi:MAG TPA: RNA polymerase sigma factor [Chitinophagaceae bacterium]|nr:RNA polymerase sigma factor [Chitinophagaceae bacterium]
MSIYKKKLTQKTSKEESLLVEKCCRGNAKAQKCLYDRFSPKMMGVCLRYAQNKADAEDILQEGFIRVFTSLNQFQFKGSLEGWIRRIMVNTSINFLKKNKKIKEQLNVEDVFPKAIDKTDMNLRTQDIMSMLNQLPEGYKTVINLYAIEGYAHKEIGEMLNISEGTSRSQYSRGKKMLREIQAAYDKIKMQDSEGGKND